jgi:cytochrome c oxidase assembly protein subunit 15
MVIVGGITRLTGSGLSMTDWNLMMGVIPPLSESAWQEVFEQYKQFPEYQQLNAGMSLGAFKAIFFWEYLHRLLGRLTGLVFIIPFLWFWIRGHFTSHLFKRSLLLFGLGASQGVMGWIMVKSGLVNVPYVSHYRLAIHLLLAIILISFCAWYALDLYDDKTKILSANKSALKSWSLAVAAVFFVQLIWGAFTAGLDAGLIYNSFPLMNGSWFPQNGWAIQPVLLNLVENPGTVQWVHRILGTLLALLVLVLWMKTRQTGASKSLINKAHILLALIVLQYVLGIFTLLFHVPVSLGVAHQTGAVIFWIGWIFYHHELNNH